MWVSAWKRKVSRKKLSIPHLPVALCVLAFLGFFPELGRGGSTLTLKGEKWTVEIDPSTLSATGHFPNASSLPISQGVETLGTAANLKGEARSASWDLPSAKMHLAVRMQNNRFIIEVVSKEAGKFTWPITGSDPRVRGVMLPLAEGFYVPVHEKLWQEFVLNESPIRTMDNLSMPLWGLDYGERSLTYILTNPFDNQLAFERQGDGLGLRVTHTFQSNYHEMRYGLMIVPGNPSPIEPARIFRKWLMETDQFVSLRQKLEKVPDLEKLFGAAQAYLWADGVMDAEDVEQWLALVNALRQPQDARTRRIVSMLPAETQKALDESRNESVVSKYLKTEVMSGLNEVIEKRDLYQSELWPLSSLPAAAQPLVARGVAELPDPELVKLNGHLFNLTFPHLLADSATFGGGISPKMIRRLQTAGFSRLLLIVPDLDVLKYLPETVAAAQQAGYLFGTYDSYHSIHPPGAKGTWATAQFDQELYDKGAIIKADGQRDRGFQGKGSHLSSIAAEPYVKKRVGAWMTEFGFNSYFIDCDATGELFDNYSHLYPATKELDMEMRLKRLAWIIDTYHVVFGSEVGASFAAGVIHFGNGMMTPVFGFFDPLLHDPKSPYFLGRYYPPGAPAVMFKQTVLPDKYKDIYFDPRYRLPLYQAALHDSIITTHHWSAPSLKFKNVLGVNEVLELLYGVPPLYHLDISELAERKQEIQRHYAFFSPNYRKLAAVPLTEFSWLTPDHLVQKTEFGDEASVVANFRASAYQYQGHAVPSTGVLLIWKKTGQAVAYASQYAWERRRISASD
jgi:hypothetical protein